MDRKIKTPALIHDVLFSESPLDEIMLRWGLSLKEIRNIRRGQFSERFKNPPEEHFKKGHKPAVVRVLGQPTPQKRKVLVFGLKDTA